MKKLLIGIILLSTNALLAQNKRAVPMVGGGDSIPSYILEEANIKAVDLEYQKAYKEAKFYTKRVYNYAMIAAAMLNDFQDTLATMDKKSDRRKYLKHVNKYLKAEFGDEISNMTIKRGKYMMKIIHKETGLSAYDIIKNYQSGVKANVWQGTVKLFGTTLKHEYDPLGDDRALAQVLREIESGEIRPHPRPAKTDMAKASLTNKEKRKLKRNKKRKEKHGEIIGL